MRFNFEVRYQLDFYRTFNGSGAWYSSQFVSSSLLGTLSPAYPGTYYDFAFKASKSGVTFRDNNSTNTPYTPKPDTLACNTKSIKINYVWFNDTLGVNKYEWTWGDRKSSEQFPEIIFDKAGSYNVKLKITKQDNSVDTYQQILFIPECITKYENVDPLHKSKSNDFFVFPNPTNSKLTILLKEIANYQFCIIDSYGKLIKVENFVGNSYEINCNDISRGLYFIKVYNNTVIYNSKFIKQ